MSKHLVVSELTGLIYLTVPRSNVKEDMTEQAIRSMILHMNNKAGNSNNFHYTIKGFGTIEFTKEVKL